MSKQLAFGDIVVVEEYLIGVIVKAWLGDGKGRECTYEVYVRNLRNIKTYPESQVDRYLVRHKELNEDEIEYQKNGVDEL